MCEDKKDNEGAKEVGDSPVPRATEKIDRKYLISAMSATRDVGHNEYDSVLFLAKDKLLPEVLDYYYTLCIASRVGEDQIRGVLLLKERVKEFQRLNPELVKLPDIELGDEESEVCRPNIIEEDFVDVEGESGEIFQPHEGPCGGIHVSPKNDEECATAQAEKRANQEPTEEEGAFEGEGGADGFGL